MATFQPPTYTEPIDPEQGNGHLEKHSLWRHYGGVLNVPYIVLIKSGVATSAPGKKSVTVFDIKGNPEVPNAEQSFTGADAGSGEAGLAHFIGGKVYTITSAESTILTAAGYGSYIS